MWSVFLWNDPQAHRREKWDQDFEAAPVFFAISDKHCRWRYERSGFVNL
jgi:hypothetical protein